MWAFDNPKMPARTSVYDHIDGICERNLTDLAVHANVELILQLRERRDADGNLLHPNIGKIGIVDASLLQAHLPQHNPKGPAERAAMLNGRWHKVGYIVYTDSNGNVTARCHGHKVVAICDLDSTLPIVWTNVPASMGERDACRQLLKTLFELWPDCPMHTLIGDSLYDQEEAFAMELEFDWDLHPVFPRAGKVSKAFPHVETEGVPSCRHGLMHRDKAEGFPTTNWRLKNGIPRGQRAREDDARIRWNCPDDIPGCANVTTRPRDNARLYTFYPRAGDSPARNQEGRPSDPEREHRVASSRRSRAAASAARATTGSSSSATAPPTGSSASPRCTSPQPASHTRPAPTPTPMPPRSTSATSPTPPPTNRSRTPRSTRPAAPPPPIRRRADRAALAAPPHIEPRGPRVRPPPHPLGRLDSRRPSVLCQLHRLPGPSPPSGQSHASRADSDRPATRNPRSTGFRDPLPGPIRIVQRLIRTQHRSCPNLYIATRHCRSLQTGAAKGKELLPDVPVQPRDLPRAVAAHHGGA